MGGQRAGKAEPDQEIRKDQNAGYRQEEGAVKPLEQMKLSVTIKAGARQNRIEKTGERQYSLWVKAPPREGRANEALQSLLGEYLGVPKSSVRIVSGHTSRRKIVEVPVSL